MRAMWDGHVYPTWERGSLAFPKASLFVAEGELAKWIEHIIRGHSLPTMHAAHGLCWRLFACLYGKTRKNWHKDPFDKDGRKYIHKLEDPSIKGTGSKVKAPVFGRICADGSLWGPILEKGARQTFWQLHSSSKWKSRWKGNLDWIATIWNSASKYAWFRGAQATPLNVLTKNVCVFVIEGTHPSPSGGDDSVLNAIGIPYEHAYRLRSDF